MHDFDAAAWTFDPVDDHAEYVLTDHAAAESSHDPAFTDPLATPAAPSPIPDHSAEPAPPQADSSHASGSGTSDDPGGIDLSGLDLAPDSTASDSADTAAAADPVPEPSDDAEVHGNPVQWTINWFYQQLDGYCGPAVVGQLVAEYTGTDITDPGHLVERAIELGLLDPDDPTGGMTLPAIETLLEDQGVPATRISGTLDDLRAALDDGHAVIAMVDSGEIWHPDRELVEDDTPDHVLVVAAVDDERGVVMLSDPGVPNGNQLEIPIEQFEQAWADSDHQMLVADHPDPDLLPAGTAPPPPHTTVITLR